jgi:hypothetical protein
MLRRRSGPVNSPFRRTLQLSRANHGSQSCRATSVGLPAAGHLTAKLTANLIDARRNQGTATDTRTAVELYGQTAPDRQESAGPS